MNAERCKHCHTKLKLIWSRGVGEFNYVKVRRIPMFRCPNCERYDVTRIVNTIRGFLLNNSTDFSRLVLYSFKEIELAYRRTKLNAPKV